MTSEQLTFVGIFLTFAVGIGSLILGIRNARSQDAKNMVDMMNIQEETISKLQTRLGSAENRLSLVEVERWKLTTVFLIGSTFAIESQVLEPLLGPPAAKEIRTKPLR